MEKKIKARILLHKLYSGSIEKLDRKYKNKNLADITETMDRPDKIYIACLFNDLYDLDKLLYEDSLSEISLIDKDAAKIIRTITNFPVRTTKEFMYDIARSPDGKEVMWLIVLDKLAREKNKQNIQELLSYLPNIIPDHII